MLHALKYSKLMAVMTAALLLQPAGAWADARTQSQKPEIDPETAERIRTLGDAASQNLDRYRPYVESLIHGRINPADHMADLAKRHPSLIDTIPYWQAATCGERCEPGGDTIAYPPAALCIPDPRYAGCSTQGLDR